MAYIVFALISAAPVFFKNASALEASVSDLSKAMQNLSSVILKSIVGLQLQVLNR